MILPHSSRIVKDGISPGAQGRAMLESNLSGAPAPSGGAPSFSVVESDTPDGANAINSGGESEAEGVKPPSSPLFIYCNRHISTFKWKTQVYQAFVEAGERKKADSFMRCGDDIGTLECCQCGYKHRVTYNCKLRICPECAKVKQSVILGKYLPYVRILDPMNIRMLTLTIKNVSDLKAGVDKIRDSFTRLRRQKYYKSKFSGGLYGIEANPDDHGDWNVHLHCVYYGHYIPQDRLSDDWQAITGDSRVTYIKRASDPKGALMYVLKYITKGINPNDEKWTGQALVDFVMALSDVRLVQAFGCFLKNGAAKKEPLECPECGYSLWRLVTVEGHVVFDDLERLLSDYRYRIRSP
jgi:hypothetical protein